MPTEGQIAANRRNAKLSTGPRTQAGRARSAMNATKSGIYAKSQIILGEDPAVLEDLKSRIYGSLQPSDEEGPLVDQLIDADWQLRRLRRAEAELWTMSISGDRKKNREKGRPEDQEVHFRAIEDNKDTFDRIYRLQASTARILNRSLETLVRLRKLSQALSPANPEPQEVDETNPIPETPSSEAVTDPRLTLPATRAETDETSPIPAAEGPCAVSNSPESPAPDPRPLIPDPAPKAPPSRFRYYNGQRIPITDVRQS
jgi:hypothetical protein